MPRNIARARGKEQVAKDFKALLGAVSLVQGCSLVLISGFTRGFVSGISGLVRARLFVALEVVLLLLEVVMIIELADV